MPVAATVGNDEQIAPLASTAQTGSPRTLPSWLTSVSAVATVSTALMRARVSSSWAAVSSAVVASWRSRSAPS